MNLFVSLYSIIVIMQTITKYIEYSTTLPNISESIASISNFEDTIIIEILIKRENMYSDLPVSEIVVFISWLTCYFVTNKSHK